MADDRVKVIYAVVVDGIGTIFVTDEALDTAWAVAAGFVATHPGLVAPTGLSCGVDLRVGIPTEDVATIKVNDVSGTLAGIFKASRADATALVTTIEPSATVPSAAANKHVGTERFGGSGTGERRRYSCIPGYNVGHKHYGQNEAAANALGSVTVSDSPIQWDGRRLAVYRVKMVGGAWQSLANAKRIWWGTFRGRGTYSRGTWSFSCWGPQQWLGGNLGRGVFEKGVRALPALVIDDEAGIGQHIMYASLDTIRLPNLKNIYDHLIHDYGDTAVFQDTTSLIGADSYEDVKTAINTFLASIVADTTEGDEFNIDGNTIYFNDAPGLRGITIEWKRGDTTASGDPYADDTDPTATARIRIWAHELVWRTLGYDVRLQNSDRDPVDNEDQYGQFQPALGMDGYWVGSFYAASPKAMLAFEEDDYDEDKVSEKDYSNDAAPRCWPPLYPGGAASFTGEPGQEFELIPTPNEPLLLAGSKSRPLPADPDDPTSPYSIGGGVGDANAQALLVLEGPYRRRGDEDQVDPVEGYAFELERELREGKTVQVVRVAYRKNADGTVSTGSGSYPRFVIMQWYDPRLFGIDFKPLQGTWGCFRDPPEDSEPIRARPLSAWDARDAGDKISEVIQRVMLTTGTGGSWYADAGLTTPLYGLDGEAAHFDVGDNDSGGTIPLDAEDATLGLGIPAAMVADPEDFAAVEDAALGPSLRRCKVCASGVLSARELFARLLSPTGLAIGYSAGKFGLFDAWSMPTPDDAVLTITTELYGGQAGKPDSATPMQSLRKESAIDRLDIKGRIDPQTKKYKVETERAATDPGCVYRPQQIRHQILGDYLIHPSVPITGNDWLGELATRWRRGFEFWSWDMSEVQFKLHEEDAIDVWPGDGVLVTDGSQIVGSDGAYGVSLAAGRVTHRSVNCEKHVISLSVLLGPEDTFRQYAPAAIVNRYDENDLGSGYRLLVNDDWLSDRSAEFDVDGFGEPTWSSEGGSATVEVFQFDGSGWIGGIYGAVSSITSSAGSCAIVLTGALTGATFRRDRHSIVVLRNWTNNSGAWVRRWYAPITDDDGTHSSGTAGIPFMGV